MTTIIVIFYLILFGIFSLIALPITWLVGLFSPFWKEKISRFISIQVLRHIMFLSGIPLTVIGQENIPKNRPVMYASNHLGTFDIVASFPYFYGPTLYVAKIEFTKIPIMVQWMRRLHCLFIDRDNIRQSMQVILSAIDFIGKGYSVAIYPEGTRNQKDEIPLTFKEGSFKIAQKTGCPIVPVAITNSAAAFERQFPWIVRTPITLEFGTPIYMENLTREEQKNLGKKVREIIIEMKSHHRI